MSCTSAALALAHPNTVASAALCGGLPPARPTSIKKQIPKQKARPLQHCSMSNAGAVAVVTVGSRRPTWRCCSARAVSLQVITGTVTPPLQHRCARSSAPRCCANGAAQHGTRRRALHRRKCDLFAIQNAHYILADPGGCCASLRNGHCHTHAATTLGTFVGAVRIQTCPTTNLNLALEGKLKHSNTQRKSTFDGSCPTTTAVNLSATGRETWLTT